MQVIEAVEATVEVEEVVGIMHLSTQNQATTMPNNSSRSNSNNSGNNTNNASNLLSNNNRDRNHRQLRNAISMRAVTGLIWLQGKMPGQTDPT